MRHISFWSELNLLNGNTNIVEKNTLVLFDTSNTGVICMELYAIIATEVQHRTF
jgi:hypothetical protein